MKFLLCQQLPRHVSADAEQAWMVDQISSRKYYIHVSCSWPHAGPQYVPSVDPQFERTMCNFYIGVATDRVPSSVWPNHHVSCRSSHRFRSHRLLVCCCRPEWESVEIGSGWLLFRCAISCHCRAMPVDHHSPPLHCSVGRHKVIILCINIE
jgi:hypothetical protein